jgi:choline transporter-like protein 2/4/5
MSLVLGMMFLTIIKVPGVLHMLIWSAVIAINVGLVAAGYHSKGVSAKWAADDIRPRNEATALFYASYVLYGLACVWTIVILFLRKRIMLAISCVREAAKAIGSMPMITLFPGLQVLGLVAFTVVWGLYMAFLASSGDIVARCICHAEDGNTTLFEVETVESKDGLCNEGCLAHKEFKYPTNTKYAALYLIFVWLWTSQFIVAMGQLVVSLAISLWYFNRNRRLVNNATFFRAFFLAATYHLGTAAFGSLVIAIVKTIGAVLTYVQNKAAKSKLRVAVVLLSVLKCLLWCFEKVLKYINAQAYVQTGTMHIHFHIGRSVVLRLTRNISFLKLQPSLGIHFVRLAKKDSS